jgi:hypothetical protein
MSCNTITNQFICPRINIIPKFIFPLEIGRWQSGVSYCDVHAVARFRGNKGGYLVTTNGCFLGIRSEKGSAFSTVRPNVLYVGQWREQALREQRRGRIAAVKSKQCLAEELVGWLQQWLQNWAPSWSWRVFREGTQQGLWLSCESQL